MDYELSDYSMSTPTTESDEENVSVGGGATRGGRQRGRASSRSRGRGVTRGRGNRGRGNRGHGRARPAQPSELNRAEQAEEAIAERQRLMMERISSMDTESLRETLIRISERNPSYIFDVLETDQAGGSLGGHHPPPNVNSPPWCVCTNCREMPEEVERVCCQQIPMNCYSRLPDFNTVVLDELVLEVARRHRQDVLAQPADPNYNRANRHTAYRQYILWKYGHLGAGVRRVIPSCCVWRIRDKYPDPFGQYVGFINGRLG